ncbi:MULTISPECIES: hypothetical protein [Salinicola]|uniref:hypothetical protein n=1 Tax=Salinicola TaxID=404432 RepID=UPI0008DCD839|nr:MULTISPECIES: hypothetical protein [Salinicola]MDF3919816.1 hypothetical protein [Salinicola salarius]OHY97141.1 hypothetical protein BC443_04900 [Salinicola sp. MIT1003]
MKYRVFSTLFVALSLAGASTQVLAQSEALKDAQEAASKVDLTKFFKSSSDAHSRSFFFGGLHQHPFTVDEAGRYQFTSSILPGESDDYKISAKLVDSNGNVLASGSGLGNTGGLEMTETLEPGDYSLQVSGQKFGTTKTGGNSFNIDVARLDASGRVVASDAGGMDDGGGIMFGGPGASGRTTAFVDESDQVATLSAPGRKSADELAVAGNKNGAASGPDFGTGNTGEASRPPATRNDNAGAPGNGVAMAAAAVDDATSDSPRAGRPPEPQMPDAFDEIVADIKVLQEGEVLSFDVAEAGTVSVTSSTFPGNEGTYRLQAKVLDANGNTVASDEGSLAVGDFDIETVLQPGRYRVWVKGQRFGSAMNAANNYTLRVQQLDTQ